MEKSSSPMDFLEENTSLERFLTPGKKKRRNAFYRNRRHFSLRQRCAEDPSAWKFHPCHSFEFSQDTPAGQGAHRVLHPLPGYGRL